MTLDQEKQRPAPRSDCIPASLFGRQPKGYDDTMLKLHVHPASQNSQKVIAIAEHLQIPHEIVEVNLFKGEQQSPEFLAKNPAGMVPLLEDEGFYLRESNAIAQYLNEKASGDLMPSGKEGHLAQQWLQWHSRHFSPAADTQRYERQIKPMMEQPTDESAVQAATQQFHRHAKLLESQLEGQQYVLGDKLSLVDFAIASSLNYAQIAQMPLEEYTQIQAWRERMSEIPAWKTQAQQAQAK